MVQKCYLCYKGTNAIVLPTMATNVVFLGLDSGQHFVEEGFTALGHSASLLTLSVKCASHL